MKRSLDKPHHNATHGLTGSPEWNSWQAMKARCTRPKHTHYAEYGDRGIKICDRWINDFTAFYADMGHRPSKKHTLDRIDVNGDYEPGNCRWATWSEQRNNQRNRGKSKYFGVTWNTEEQKWYAFIRLHGRQIYLGTFDNEEKAAIAFNEAAIINLPPNYPKLNKVWIWK